MKECSICKQIFPFDNFNKKGFKNNGEQRYKACCKLCDQKRSRELYSQNKEQRQSKIYSKRKARFKVARKEINLLKSKKGCCFCEENEACCLEFHHFDPSIKDFIISAAIGNVGIERTAEEIMKCVVSCSNCHRKVHAGMLKLKDGFKVQKKDLLDLLKLSPNYKKKTFKGIKKHNKNRTKRVIFPNRSRDLTLHRQN